eukprot:m.1438734 g.1438734  ORF g.1438734 m.1438734 type:complete len:82 (-) comp25093_c0_seq8:643-888(-)
MALRCRGFGLLDESIAQHSANIRMCFLSSCKGASQYDQILHIDRYASQAYEYIFFGKHVVQDMQWDIRTVLTAVPQLFLSL